MLGICLLTAAAVRLSCLVVHRRFPALGPHVAIIIINTTLILIIVFAYVVGLRTVLPSPALFV